MIALADMELHHCNHSLRSEIALLYSASGDDAGCGNCRALETTT